MHQLNFAQGVAWDGTRAAQRQVARFSRKRQPTRSAQEDADEKREVKRLTSRMKEASSAKELIDVLDEAMGGPVFDFIHASAAYTRLVALKRRRCLQEEDWDSAGVLRLHTRVEDMVLRDQLLPRETANVLWSIAQLFDQFRLPTQLLAALVKSMPTKVTDMNAFDLSNCLWACARLKNVAPTDPNVLEAVPVIAAQIPSRAKHMVPQALSNCLWAAALLKDEVPKVLRIVPAIVGEIPAKIRNMNGQDLSNSLEALVLLEDGGMHDILRSAAARLNSLLPTLRGKDFRFTVPVVVWACAKADVYDGELLASVAAHFGSRTKLSALPDFGVCALSWSYQVLDTDGDFEDFKALLMSETEKRGFSEADVQSCRFGRSGWNYR